MGKPAGYRRLGIFLVAAAISVLGFCVASIQLEGPGFPLDDAWIHQTYARNLVREGSWSFQRGEWSAGSTSPLWTIFLIPGHLLSFPPVLWAGILGVLLLAGGGHLAGKWLQAGLTGRLSSRVWLAGMIIPLEWHLVWAALSGMEVLAAGFLALVFMALLRNREEKAVPLGALMGLGVWLRPDLLTLAAAAGWHWLFTRRTLRERFLWAGRAALGFLALFLPYLSFQWLISGSPWPSTFYAKQAEYAALRDIPLLTRYVRMWRAPLAGVLMIALPGLFLWLVQRIRHRRWRQLAPLVWVLLYVGAFALRLPVTYQHGRYLMPILPLLLSLSAQGAIRWLAGRPRSRATYVLRRAWPAAATAVAAVFWVLGGRAYARDVAIIETEMVRTAQWIAENTEQRSLIAAHDVGALGYYGEREILDMAGLMSPEVIPILRDEQALETMLSRRRADYLMTFPDWYPGLVAGREPIFRTDGIYSPAEGGSNMAVYRWP